MPKPTREQLRHRLGRLSPDMPHPFVLQGTETVEHGGTVAPSAVCGVCGRRADDARHGGSIESQGPLRDVHGPYGQ